MEKIPLSFQDNGKSYHGTLDAVHGAGAKVWHLMINNYYHGQLTFTSGEFRFSSNSGKFENLAAYFGEVIMLWYE